MCPSPVPEAVKIRRPLVIETEINNQHLVLETSYGVFSPREVDAGTWLILNHLKVEEDYDCFDLGCGYGPIGIWLAKNAPKGQTIMADKDFVAVEHAQQNIKRNRVDNAKAILSNGFSKLKDEKFDLIVSNIPAKVGNEMLYLFLYDAFHHLKPGGQFVVVTVNGLRHFCKRTFNEVFGDYKKVKQGKAYTISLAHKN